MNNLKTDVLFYFPTTVLVLDDDKVFLNEIEEFLTENNIVAIPFSSSSKFLHYLTRYHPPVSLDFFLDVESDYYNSATKLIRNRLSNIHKLIYNPQRFNQIAVVIVDYEILGETGLDVCKSIKNPYIKKIMLTNKATQMVAINALNNNIIDFFVLKQDIVECLVDAIKYQSFNYFKEISKTIEYPCDFMKEPFILNLFSIYKNQFKPVEFYNYDENGSLLMFDENFNSAAVLIQRESSMRTLCKSFEHNNIPPEILLPMQRREAIPVGWNVAKYLTGEYKFQIEKCNKITGIKDDYYYAFTKNLDQIGIDRKKVLSYKEKLELSKK